MNTSWQILHSGWEVFYNAWGSISIYNYLQFIQLTTHQERARASIFTIRRKKYSQCQALGLILPAKSHPRIEPHSACSNSLPQ